MANNFRVQVVSQVNVGDVSRDFAVNVLHYATATTLAPALGDAVLAAYTTSPGLSYGSMKSVSARVYDTSLPLHSPPVYIATHAGAGTLSLGPRQVAVCLSFYSGLNIRGQRGRIYLGPWPQTDMGELITTTKLGQIITFAGLLKNPGGADVVHQIWHPKTATWSNVSNYFVNDRWDTMRSRLGKETQRRTLP